MLNVVMLSVVILNAVLLENTLSKLHSTGQWLVANEDGAREASLKGEGSVQLTSLY
jgi:hypothetical protein